MNSQPSLFGNADDSAPVSAPVPLAPIKRLSATSLAVATPLPPACLVLLDWLIEQGHDPAKGPVTPLSICWAMRRRAEMPRLAAALYEQAWSEAWATFDAATSVKQLTQSLAAISKKRTVGHFTLPEIKHGIEEHVWLLERAMDNGIAPEWCRTWIVPKGRYGCASDVIRLQGDLVKVARTPNLRESWRQTVYLPAHMRHEPPKIGDATRKLDSLPGAQRMIRTLSSMERP